MRTFFRAETRPGSRRLAAGDRFTSGDADGTTKERASTGGDTVVSGGFGAQALANSANKTIIARLGARKGGVEIWGSGITIEINGRTIDSTERTRANQEDPLRWIDVLCGHRRLVGGVAFE